MLINSHNYHFYQPLHQLCSVDSFLCHSRRCLEPSESSKSERGETFCNATQIPLWDGEGGAWGSLSPFHRLGRPWRYLLSTSHELALS